MYVCVIPDEVAAPPARKCGCAHHRTDYRGGGFAGVAICSSRIQLRGSGYNMVECNLQFSTCLILSNMAV